MSENQFLPYGTHDMRGEDIQAVTSALQSDWLDHGPLIPEFEHALADAVGAEYCVAVINGPGAMSAALQAVGVSEGDCVITSPNAFPAVANCIGGLGGKVLFCDIDPETGLMDPNNLERVCKTVTGYRLKAIIPNHFAGQPADLPTIHDIAKRHGAAVIDDASHGLGGGYVCEEKSYRTGGSPHSDMTVFSFEQTGHVAMGQGGAVTTSNGRFAEILREQTEFGIDRQNRTDKARAFDENGVPNNWYYDINRAAVGNPMTEMQAALGLSQLKRLHDSIRARQALAATYTRLLSRQTTGGHIVPLKVRENVNHGYHLFTVRVDFRKIGQSRAVFMNRLRAIGIGTQVHYMPVHLQSYYRATTAKLTLPGMDRYYETTLSLPMYTTLAENDITRVVASMNEILQGEHHGNRVLTT